MKRKSNKNGFTGCAKAYIRNLQEEGRYSTAHVYKNAILSFTRFCVATFYKVWDNSTLFCGI